MENFLPMNRLSLRLSAVALCLLLAGTSCQNPFARRSDTVSRMDAPRERESKPLDTRRRDMVLVVTTDAQGEIAQINVQRSSGKESVDAYVIQSIRDGWPHQPSTRSVVAVSYTAAKGFTEPKVLSSTPVS